MHDAHQPEYFELRLIFGFEQSSFGCRKKPSLTSLAQTISNIKELRDVMWKLFEVILSTPAIVLTVATTTNNRQTEWPHVTRKLPPSCGLFTILQRC